MQSGFGPSALATPANAVTAARLAATPVLVATVLASGNGASWFGVALWVALAGSDGLDGWLARRQGATSSGAFLDPLADKVLVLGAMAALVVRGALWWLPVVVIAGREAAVSVYRWRSAAQGVSVPARPLAKAKTWMQDIAVGLALLPSTSRHPGVVADAIWLAVALTVVSGAQYLADARGRARAV